MTPHDLFADTPQLLRFQNQIAYADRMRPPDDELRADTELLGSAVGVLVVAWLWPTDDYQLDADLFEAAVSGGQAEWEGAIKTRHPAVGDGDVEAVSWAVDRWRERRRSGAARRFEEIIALTAQEVNCSLEDVKAHLMWSTPLSQGELDGLLNGHFPFPFHVIVELCDALRLQFEDGWVLDDPRLLAHRIRTSICAREISHHLRLLTLDNLSSVKKRLPQHVSDVDLPQDFDSYRAPEVGGRYSSLYEVLVADNQDCPEYTLAQVGRILLDADEPGLPESARKSRSWWAGNGAKSEGRPQVSAWWGAGYRVQHIITDSTTNEIVAVKFEALPRRSEWFANPDRTSRRGYRAPGTKVRISTNLGPQSQRHPANVEKRLLALASQFDFDAFRKALSPFAENLDALRRSYLPDDPHVRNVVQFLHSVGEADRFQIERHLSQVQNESVDPAWLTNLLTKARRHGWTINKGTRKHPRWAAPRYRALLLAEIAENLRLEPPTVDSESAVPLEFLHDVAEAAGVPTLDSSAVQVARTIVEEKGRVWQPEFESADKSVTSLGLKEILDSIGMLMPPEDEIVVLA